MRLRRTRADTPTVDSGRPPATFSGFADPDPNLYEFRTSDGQYVYLHEMDCADIDFQPMSRRLAITFECIASDLMEPLTLTLSFEQAEIYQWLDDPLDEATLINADSGRIRGQISDLAQLGDACRSLRLLTCVWASRPARSHATSFPVSRPETHREPEVRAAVSS